MYPPKPHRRVPMIAVKPDPVTMTIFEPRDGAKIRGPGGPGTIDYVCPTCEAVLLEGFNEGQIRDVAVTCSKCGTTSGVPYSG